MCNLILLYSKYIFHSSVFDLSSSPSLCYFSLFTLFLYVYSPTISAFSLSLSLSPLLLSLLLLLLFQLPSAFTNGGWQNSGHSASRYHFG